MISVEVLLKHMAWANQEIYKEVQKLDNEVLNYYVIDPEWTVEKILIHIVGAGHLYGQRLDGDPFSPFKLEGDDDGMLIDQLLTELERIDQGLIKFANVEDGDLTYMTSQGERTSKISTIISQMIFHAAEHRAQIVAALDKHNVREINLDRYSVFSYIESIK
jgi:uncharacterized damage-inducible protein DinB